MIVRRNVAAAPLRWTDEVRDLAAHSNLIFELVHRDLTIRYKRSLFGFLWTMLHPLLLMLIFTIVFSRLFRRETPHYETYFLSAYIAWNFFSQTTSNSMASVAWNGPLMKRVRVPRSIFTLASNLSGLVNLGLSLVALLIIMLFARMPLTPSLAFVPVSLLVVGIFTFGVSLMVTAVSIFFADVREMVQAGLPALLYMTPVIYPVSIVPDGFRWIVEKNPLTVLVGIVRDPIYYGRMPSPQAFGTALLISLISLVLGWLIFSRLAPRFDSRL
ncbi:MAG: ABC transporter permease [Thermoanaerobaculia bacterium]|nr:ABC transporter permease [Thermoanaerobaculia bacterium]